MSLSDIDRILLQRCLDRDPRAWRDFVDRFIGLVVHVVQRTTSGRGMSIDDATRDDLVSEVFLVFIRHDLAVLRRFQRQSSLATYLTVIARRIVVRRIVQWNRQGGIPQAPAPNAAIGPNAATGANTSTASNGHAVPNGSANGTAANGPRVDPQTLIDSSAAAAVEKIDDVEQVEQLMMRLDAREASVVRMYHLEGKSYQQISRAIGLSENSIGPMLTRARGKMGS